jgi:hypothetical protein
LVYLKKNQEINGLLPKFFCPIIKTVFARLAVMRKMLHFVESGVYGRNTLEKKHQGGSHTTAGLIP